MSLEILSENTCISCVGACCSNVRLALYADEAVDLAMAGTDLSYVPFPYHNTKYEFLRADEERQKSWTACLTELSELALTNTDPEMKWLAEDIIESVRQMKRGQGLFVMRGDCAFLQDGMCRNYENRPQICRDFPAGSPNCIDFRKQAGVSVAIRTTQAAEALIY